LQISRAAATAVPPQNFMGFADDHGRSIGDEPDNLHVSSPMPFAIRTKPNTRKRTVITAASWILSQFFSSSSPL
jgi:hypothetical protein